MKKLSKRVRFEVLKRDQFKCQYCGAAAPDVLLHVDHIHPKSKGGGNDLLNLVTACAGCNGGKAAVPLDDSSAVKRQEREMREMAERREQIAMLVEWRDSLARLDDEQAQILIDRVNARMATAFPGECLSAVGRENVKGWLKRFGLSASLYGISQATNTEDFEALFAQMEQYAAAARKVEREPELRDFWRIRALLRARRFHYGPEWRPVQDMRGAFKAGVAISEIEAAASEAEDYQHFLALIGYEV